MKVVTAREIHKSDFALLVKSAKHLVETKPDSYDIIKTFIDDYRETLENITGINDFEPFEKQLDYRHIDRAHYNEVLKEFELQILRVPESYDYARPIIEGYREWVSRVSGLDDLAPIPEKPVKPD